MAPTGGRRQGGRSEGERLGLGPDDGIAVVVKTIEFEWFGVRQRVRVIVNDGILGGLVRADRLLGD